MADLGNSARARDLVPDSSHRDAGSSFIEVLVAVVLLGIAVVGILTALRTTVIGTAVERDHSRAQQWLQSAVGVLAAEDRRDCDDGLGEATVRTEYEAAIRAETGIIPPGWQADPQLTIVQPIKVWDGNQYWDPYDPSAPATCFDDDGFELQLITIQVTSPDGSILETVQVVKDGS